MHFLNYILWSPNPAIIPGWDIPRWYGLLFALGFILSQQIMYWIFKKEGKPEKHVDKLTIYMVVASILGARLGHCLFYDPERYLANPIEILKIWEGGLASHGGALGILLALYFFSKKYPYSMLWLLDRLVIVVALTGALIRTGNLMNSEMEGIETGTDTYGAVYAGFTKEYLKGIKEFDKISLHKGGEWTSDRPGKVPITLRIALPKGQEYTQTLDNYIEGILRINLQSQPEITQHIFFGENAGLQKKVYQDNGRFIVDIYGIGTVRHLAQIYEAIYCLVLMVILFLLWKNKRFVLPSGFNFAIFMIVLWSARFVDEFFKMDQVDFEADMALNMGQILSIPMTLIGVVILWVIYRRKNQVYMAERSE